LKYGFEEMNLEKINAAAHCDNIGSRRVLQKAGFRELDVFTLFDFQAVWFGNNKRGVQVILKLPLRSK